MTSFGDKTLTIKRKCWVPPLGIEPVTIRLWDGIDSNELLGRLKLALIAYAFKTLL